MYDGSLFLKSLYIEGSFLFDGMPLISSAWNQSFANKELDSKLSVKGEKNSLTSFSLYNGSHFFHSFAIRVVKDTILNSVSKVPFNGKARGCGPKAIYI